MTTTTTTLLLKDTLLTALHRWIRQRPGLDYGNYGNPTSYHAELRQIARDKRDAVTLLRAVELSSMTGEELLEGFRAFSGRLEWKDDHLEYCTGQYWPTEYRKAVCAVAALALWDYYREDFSASAEKNESPGDAVRRNFRRLFGQTLQRKWFE